MIFYLNIGLTSLYMGIIMVHLSSLEYVCRLLPRAKRVIITPVQAILFFGLCFAALRVSDLSGIMDRFMPYLIAVSSFAIPGVLLLVAAIRKKGGTTPAEGRS